MNNTENRTNLKLSEKVYVYTPPKPLLNDGILRFIFHWALVLGLLSVAVFLRLHNLTRLSIWLDEAYDLDLARHLTFWQSFTYSNPGVPHAPLFTVLMNVWQGFVGVSELRVRLFALVTGIFLVLATYTFVRITLNRAIAYLTLFLVALSPLLIYWSQSIRPYGILALLVLISMFLVYKAANQPKNNLWWLGWGLSLISLLYFHYLSFHIILAQIIYLSGTYFLSQSKNPNGKNSRDNNILIRGGVVLILAGLSFLPWLENFINHSKYGPAIYTINGVEDIFAAFQAFSGWFLNPVLDGLLCAIFFGLFALGSGWLWKANRNLALLLVSWAVLPVVTTWLISLLRPTFLIRYFAFCIPAYLIVVAAGIYSLYRFNFSAAFGLNAQNAVSTDIQPTHRNITLANKVLPTVATLLIIWLSLSAYFQYNHYYKQQPYREMVNYIVDNQWEGDKIMFANPWGYIKHPFDFYYRTVLGAPGNMEEIAILGAKDILTPTKSLPEFNPDEVKAVFESKPWRVWVIRAHDEIAGWTIDNVFPAIPSNYTPVTYRVYSSTEQGEIALVLYVRNDAIQKQQEFEKQRAEQNKKYN